MLLFPAVRPKGEMVLMWFSGLITLTVSKIGQTILVYRPFFVGVGFGGSFLIRFVESSVTKSD